MLRRLPPTLKRASCTDSLYNDSRQLEWPGLLQRCALESDHLWNVIPTIIFTFGAMAGFSELYHYLPNSRTCIAILWKWFWVVQQVCRRVNVCQLWVCPHLHVISGISQPFIEQVEKLSISYKFCSKKMILPIVFERWKADASMLRESFHCLCSIDTNACFA